MGKSWKLHLKQTFGIILKIHSVVKAWESADNLKNGERKKRLQSQYTKA